FPLFCPIYSFSNYMDFFHAREECMFVPKKEKEKEKKKKKKKKKKKSAWLVLILSRHCFN
ncbi:MAG: hypothetical protein N7Q72_03700, partial [Spiroplasma sp. Tabriz.8]|nr:hypothetical protein [Spiroplasma sp. Tabriz.8]